MRWINPQTILSLGSLPSKLLCFAIKAYRYFISPWLKTSCRFYPSCSRYALEAIQIFGVRKGCYLASCRLLKCHPWSLGGYDPVNKEKV